MAEYNSLSNSSRQTEKLFVPVFVRELKQHLDSVPEFRFEYPTHYKKIDNLALAIQGSVDSSRLDPTLNELEDKKKIWVGLLIKIILQKEFSRLLESWFVENKNQSETLENTASSKVS